MYQRIIKPLLFRIDPETVHDWVMSGLRIASPFHALWQPVTKMKIIPEIRQILWGLQFPNPLGLAAGFDKNGENIKVWPALGFGFMELGTITPLPQEGNPKPRIFRLPNDHALINRCGFNNRGMEETAQHLHRLRNWIQSSSAPIGINIGKQKTTPLENAAEDYRKCFEALWPYAAYFAINVSSPNTPELRRLQEKESLTEILLILKSANQKLSAHYHSIPKPVLVKIAPDLEIGQLEDLLEASVAAHADGIIICNTTIRRDLNLLSSKSLIQETGGLSGQPLKSIATELIRFVYRRTSGKVPIIGVGGIETGDDAYEKILAGASLIQMYTGFIYQGPLACKRILKRLAERLKADGFKNVSEAVGQENK